MKRYLTLRELAAELGIPKSTVVKYKDFYTEFLPMHGEGKRKKFEQSAIDVIGTVRELREVEKKDWAEIREALAEKFGAIANLPEAPEPPETEDEEENAPPRREEIRPAVYAPAARDVQTTQVVAQVAQRLNHLTHIVMALAGEIIQIREAVNRPAAPPPPPECDAKLLRSLENQMTGMQVDLERAYAEIHSLGAFASEADARSKKRLQAILAYIKKDIGRLEQKLTASGADASGDMMAKVKKWMEDHSALQTRYMMVLNENEALKTRLRETKLQPREEEERRSRSSSGTRRGFLGKRRG